MTESRHHPLDFDSLKKGDVITRQKLESICLPVDERDLRIYMMKLGGQIESEREDLLVRYKGFSIHIMHDPEADEVTHERVRRGAKSIIRNTQRRARIDQSKFDSEQMRISEHRDRFATALALTMRKRLIKEQREERLLKESDTS